MAIWLPCKLNNMPHYNVFVPRRASNWAFELSLTAKCIVAKGERERERERDR
jgi:hypothetical protein